MTALTITVPAEQVSQLRRVVAEELTTAADALSDAATFTRHGKIDPDEGAETIRQARDALTFALGLSEQLGHRLAEPGDLLA